MARFAAMRVAGLAGLILLLALPLAAQDVSKPPPAGAPVPAEPGKPGATAAPSAPLAQCPDNMASLAGSSETLTCTCPAMMTRDGAVWGTDTYTADSRTCRAAVHAGAIPLSGGEVTVRMLRGQPRYLGTTRNGFATNNYGPYDASYRI